MKIRQLVKDVWTWMKNPHATARDFFKKGPPHMPVPTGTSTPAAILPAGIKASTRRARRVLKYYSLLLWRHTRRWFDATLQKHAKRKSRTPQTKMSLWLRFLRTLKFYRLRHMRRKRQSLRASANQSVGATTTGRRKSRIRQWAIPLLIICALLYSIHVLMHLSWSRMLPLIGVFSLLGGFKLMQKKKRAFAVACFIFAMLCWMVLPEVLKSLSTIKPTELWAGQGKYWTLSVGVIIFLSLFGKKLLQTPALSSGTTSTVFVYVLVTILFVGSIIDLFATAWGLTGDVLSPTFHHWLEVTWIVLTGLLLGLGGETKGVRRVCIITASLIVLTILGQMQMEQTKRTQAQIVAVPPTEKQWVMALEQYDPDTLLPTQWHQFSPPEPAAVIEWTRDCVVIKRSYMLHARPVTCTYVWDRKANPHYGTYSGPGGHGSWRIWKTGKDKYDGELVTTNQQGEETKISMWLAATPDSPL